MNRWKATLSSLAILAIAASCSILGGARQDAGWPGRPEGFSDRYSLEEMVVLSRHNIRSPLSGGGSVLSRITPHSWFEWTSKPAELSRKGAASEIRMGMFFRQWAGSERLIDKKIPLQEQTRFYANSLQRTVRTAECFLEGMFPGGGIEVERHMATYTMDPVFNPQTTGVDEGFRSLALKEIAAMGGRDGFRGIGRKMAENFRLMEDVLDMKDSPAALNDTTAFCLDDAQILIREHAEPAMRGGLKMAASASDALILQYYEEQDDARAAFGHRLGFGDWERIAEVKDWYQDVLFTGPAVARNVSRPLLQVIRSELLHKDRRFTFLCGHDSNLGSVMAALGVSSFSLPDALEKTTPIGAKLVFEKFLGRDGKEYADIMLVYAPANKLRRGSKFSLASPPSYIRLEISSLKANDDGLYLLSDLSAHIGSLL